MLVTSNVVLHGLNSMVSPSAKDKSTLFNVRESTCSLGIVQLHSASDEPILKNQRSLKNELTGVRWAAIKKRFELLLSTYTSNSVHHENTVETHQRLGGGELFPDFGSA